MLSNEPEKINKAIRDCVAFCCKSHPVLPKVAEFLSTLTDADGWQRDEIRTIELAALKVLPWRLPVSNRAT